MLNRVKIPLLLLVIIFIINGYGQVTQSEVEKDINILLRVHRTSIDPDPEWEAQFQKMRDNSEVYLSYLSEGLNFNPDIDSIVYAFDERKFYKYTRIISEMGTPDAMDLLYQFYQKITAMNDSLEAHMLKNWALYKDRLDNLTPDEIQIVTTAAKARNIHIGLFELMIDMFINNNNDRILEDCMARFNKEFYGGSSGFTIQAKILEYINIIGADHPSVIQFLQNIYMDDEIYKMLGRRIKSILLKFGAEVPDRDTGLLVKLVDSHNAPPRRPAQIL